MTACLRLYLVYCVLFAHAAATTPRSTAKPNVVLMVLDDVGHADLSMNGGDFPTPNLDELARTGANLKRMYVQPVCSPTRSALMTGRFPFHTGLQHFTTLLPGGTAKLPLAPHKTLAEMFKGQGYSTSMIGKWHLGYAKWDYTPTGRGFDSYAGYLQGQCDYYNKTLGGGAPGQATGYDFWNNQTRNSDADDGSYTMATYRAEAERLAAEVWSAPDADPFFLYYAQQEIHVPLQRPPQEQHVQHCAKVTSTPERLTLCSMASALDAEVGRFVADLKARGLWDNTLLWVITDNGGMTNFNNYTFPASASSNWPLRAGKTTLFEGGVRGVSFVNGGALPAAARGTESHELMHAADVPVTLAKLAGADADVAELDGVDLMPTIASGAKGARTEVPINVNPNCFACKQQVTSKATAVPYSALLQRSADGQHDWKLVSGYAGVYDDYWTNEDRGYARLPAPANDTNLPPSSWRLYDIARDETESRNVAAENPSVVQTMVARLAELGDARKGYVKPQLNVPAVGPLGKKATPSAANNYTWVPFLS